MDAEEIRNLIERIKLSPNSKIIADLIHYELCRKGVIVRDLADGHLEKISKNLGIPVEEIEMLREHFIAEAFRDSLAHEGKPEPLDLSDLDSGDSKS